MLRTKYNITLEIDDEQFFIEVKEPSKTEKIKLEKHLEDKTSIFKKQIENEKEAETLTIEIEEAEELLNTNKELSRESGIIDKLSLLLENKKLTSKISELKKRRSSIEKIDIKAMNTAFEEVAKEKYEILVSGNDKEKLKEYMKNNGVSYSLLWEEMQKEVLKAHEKK